MWRILALTLFFLLKGRRERYHWMFHYLRGSGTPMVVPRRLIRKSLHAINVAVEIGPNCDGLFCVNSTQFYSGRGFRCRPELMYMVGGFSFRLEHLKKNLYRLTGADLYDWHQAEDYYTGEKFWYISPAPSWLVRLARVPAGDKRNRWFPIIKGNHGVSNAFWADMEGAGAKPFVTHIEGTLPLSYVPPVWEEGREDP